MRTLRKPYLLSCLSMISPVGCNSGEGPVAEGGAGQQFAGCDRGPELHVLFIGNSHTYVNDLPNLVREMACAAGTKLVTQQVTPGGASFTDHAASADTLDAIKADAWDFVILQDQQQQPGFRLADVEAQSLPAVRTLVDAIVTNRTATRRLFSMVWARRDGDPLNCATYRLVCSYEGFTRAIAQGYELYAERTDSELASIALAWAAVRADDNAPLSPLSLWDDDGSHPALPGSYLAASVLVGSMLSKPTVPLAYEAGLDPVVAKYLRTVGDRTVSADKADPRVSTRERVSIACGLPSAHAAGQIPREIGPCELADTAAVTITLSPDSCEQIAFGTASVSGRIHTTLGCQAAFCTTVPLGGWHEVPGAAIKPGLYQVHAYADANANGKLDRGDLEACGQAFRIGGGDDLSLSMFGMR